MARIIDVLLVPFDGGGGSVPGARTGPSAFISAGILEALKNEGHTVNCRDLREESLTPEIFDCVGSSKGKIQYEREYLEVLALLNARTFASRTLGHTPLVIGGDHSIAVGSIGGGLAVANVAQKKLGCVWIDAHNDAHTDRTSHSHHANGMPLGFLLGRGARRVRESIGFRKLHPKHLLHIGAGKTDCEPEEIALFERFGVENFPLERLRKEGWVPVWNALFGLTNRIDEFAVSVDLDAFDKRWCPAVSFQSEGGLHPDHGYWYADQLAKTGKVTQIDIVEYNAHHEEYVGGRGKTADFAIELACRLLWQPPRRKSFIAGK